MAKAKRFDAADYLDNPDVIAAYLSEALATRDQSIINAAIGTIARAKGMTAVASEVGLSRESLYRSLDAGGNPGFATVIKVLESFGVQLEAKPREPV
jgi:probable addiction module antidote protein